MSGGKAILGKIKHIRPHSRYLVALLLFWVALGLWLGVFAPYFLELEPGYNASLTLLGEIILMGGGIFIIVAITWLWSRYRAMRDNLYAHLPGLVFGITPQGKIEFASDLGLKWLGIDEKAGSSHYRIQDVLSANKDLADLRERALLTDGQIVEAEIAVFTVAEQRRWLRIQCRTMPPHTPDSMIECIAWDITELVRERTLRTESEQRLEQMANLSSEGLFLHDAGKCVDANIAAERMFGHSRDELLLMSAVDIVAESSLQMVIDNIQSGYDKPYEATARHKDGTLFPCEINGRNVVIDGVKLRLTSFRDISERKIAEDLVRYQATHDALTDLPNRYLFVDRLEYAIKLAKRRKERFALMYVDLDGFKQLNDMHGHVIGDKVLVEVAQRLRHSLREVDTVARIGGDEFTVILPGTETLEDAEIVARKVLQSLTSSPINISSQKQTYEASASIGIALYPEHADNFDDMISVADKAMYQAKKSGKDQFRFAAPVTSQT